MYKSPSITFFVVGIAIIASASCGIKDGFLDTLSQTKATLEEETVLNSLINTTNSSLLSSFPYRVKVAQNETESDVNDLEKLKRELFIASKMHATETCRKNTTKCMEEDAGYYPTLKQLTKYLLPSVPPFDLSSIDGINLQCRKDSLRYIRDLAKFKLWTLKMYDANPKLPTGFLNGNINQLGDFDMCLSVNSDEWNIKGQYCLASLQVEVPQNSYLSTIHSLVYSHSPFKSRLEDPGHRVPRFSSINWAFCVPHSCRAKDVEHGLQKSVNKLINGTALKIQLEVDPTMCQNAEPKAIPMSTILTSGFFVTIILISLTSTAYDFYTEGKNVLFTAFSLKKNLSTLFSLERPPNDLEAVHGIRFINAIMLIIAHKSMAVFFIPYTNRTRMSEILGMSWTVVGRAASLYTDPFIMMSGMLTAHSFLRKLQKTNKINVTQEYISRLIRIVPSLGALILFCTFVFPWISTGPQWNLVVTHHSENCKKYWWRNMLFIHNYFGFKDMCLTHTHHVGIDTQLFFLAPLLVLVLWKWPKRGITILVSLAMVSTMLRYYVTYTKKLSNYIHYGTSIQQLFSTADNMYILPAHRLTVYVIGILLGYLLHNCRNFRLSENTIIIGNILAVISFCVSFLGPAFMGSISYVYNPTHAAWYAAFAPIFWCLSFAWIIFRTHIGQKGLFGKLFSQKIFLITTRLSYAIYLTQFPIFFYNVGVTRTPEYYTVLSKNVDLAEIVWIFFLSGVLYVLFELPFQNIRDVIFKKESTQKQVPLKEKLH